MTLVMVPNETAHVHGVLRRLHILVLDVLGPLHYMQTADDKVGPETFQGPPTNGELRVKVWQGITLNKQTIRKRSKNHANLRSKRTRR